MKLIVAIAALFFFPLEGSFAQIDRPAIPVAPDTIGSFPLSLAERYTTNLIFPFTIARVDTGAGNIVVRKWGKNQNVLLLRARKANFRTANLSVYLENGALYSFLVRYADTLKVFNYYFPRDGMSAGTLPEAALSVQRAPSFMSVRAKSQQLRARLRSIYLKDNLLWLTFHLQNRSQIAFHPGAAVYFARERRRARRTAVQSIYLTPAFVAGNADLAGSGETEFTVAFYPFVLPPEKRLIIEWKERTNGRSLRMVLAGRHLLKAKELKSQP